MLHALTRPRRGGAVAAAMLSLLVATFVGLSSTSSAGTNASPKPVKGGTIVVGVDAESPPGWDPANNTIGLSGQIIQGAIFDALTSPAPDGTYKPELAQSVTPNKTNTVWTIRLRPNLRFQDGTPLDAQAVVAYMTRFHDPKLSSNGEEFSGFISSFRAVGKLTVVLTCPKPKGAMPLYLSGPLGQIASPTAYDKLGKGFSQHPVGAGPYMLTEWVLDDHVTLKRWNGYFRKDQPYADTVIIRPIPDEAARAAAIRAGDIDIMFTQNPTDIKNFRTNKSVRLTEIPYGTTGLYLNITKPPTDDIRVRQAIAYALNKQQLIDTVWNGIGNVTNNPFKKGTFWYKKITEPWDNQNLTKAKALVAAYEASTGKKVAFSLISRVSATERNYEQALQAQLQAAGMNVTLEPITDDASYITKIFDGSYNVTTRLHQSFLDPEYQITRLHIAGGPINVEHYTTPALEKNIQIGIQSSDPATRKKAYDNVQKILLDNVIGIFVRTNTIGVVARPNIRGNFNWTFPGGARGLGHQYITLINPDSLWRSK
jgi:peptide/nickel transport system substrate-binding protein